MTPAIKDKIVVAAGIMQITATAYILWLGISSASNGETKKATWLFIATLLYTASFLWMLFRFRPQGSADLMVQIDALKAANLQQQQDWAKDRDALLKKIEALENPIPQVAMSAYAPGSREAHIEEQWRSLNAAEKELVRFVLFNGTVDLIRVINHMLKEGFADGLTVLKAVQSRTSFILGSTGDVHPQFTINAEIKPDLLRLSR